MTESADVSGRDAPRVGGPRHGAATSGTGCHWTNSRATTVPAYDNERTFKERSMAEREWILLNPGPANTTAAVRQALVMPDLCHSEPEFFEMMRSCRDRLVRLACGCGSASRGRPTDEASGEMVRKDASRGRATDEASGEMVRKDASRGRPADEASGEMVRKDASRGRATDEASGEMVRKDASRGRATDEASG